MTGLPPPLKFELELIPYLNKGGDDEYPGMTINIKAITENDAFRGLRMVNDFFLNRQLHDPIHEIKSPMIKETKNGFELCEYMFAIPRFHRDRKETPEPYIDPEVIKTWNIDYKNSY